MKRSNYTPGRNIFGNKAETHLVKPTKRNMNTVILEMVATIVNGHEIEYTVDTSALSPADRNVFVQRLEAMMGVADEMKIDIAR